MPVNMRVFYVLAWVAWNTFLALVPVVLAYVIHRLATNRPSGFSSRVLPLVLGLPWLAFMPNTCYLLTEWRHFLDTVEYRDLSTRWQVDSGAALDLMIYTLFYFCYSALGMIAFALAIRPMAQILKDRGAALWVWAIPFFMLMSVGVYLGLILRFNSWDLLTRPGLVWASVMNLLNRPVLVTFILLFAGFLWFAFWVMDVWIDGLCLRWQRITHRQ